MCDREVFFFLPPVGSPGGSFCGRNGRSCSSSGSAPEDLPLHPQPLSALHYPGVHTQTQIHKQNDGVCLQSPRQLKHAGKLAPLTTFSMCCHWMFLLGFMNNICYQIIFARNEEIKCYLIYHSGCFQNYINYNFIFYHYFKRYQQKTVTVKCLALSIKFTNILDIFSSNESFLSLRGYN